MRVLAFSDVHGDWGALERIVKTEADLYVCLGDLTFGEVGIERAAEYLNTLPRLLCVPGNNERPETLRKLLRHPVLHGERVEVDGVVFGGIGGSPHTPFHTIHEWAEEEAWALLERMGRVDVLLSHAPPAGTPLALTRSGVDAGSKAVREYILTFRPRIALVGHVHERAGERYVLGDTTVINPGKGMVLTIP